MFLINVPLVALALPTACLLVPESHGPARQFDALSAVLSVLWTGSLVWAIIKLPGALHYATSDAAAQDTVESIKRDSGRAFAIQAVLGTAGDVDTLFASLERGLDGHRWTSSSTTPAGRRRHQPHGGRRGRSRDSAAQPGARASGGHP